MHGFTAAVKGTRYGSKGDQVPCHMHSLSQHPLPPLAGCIGVVLHQAPA